MLINYESPLERNLYLAEPSDNSGGDAGGQVSEPVTEVAPMDSGDTIDVGETTEPSYFHSYEDDEGTKTDFKDANELNDFIRRGGMMRKAFTQKTQGLADERRTYEANKARQDAEYTTFLQSKQENDKINKSLESLPPEVFARLKQGIQNQPRKQARDPEVDQMLKDFKSNQKDRELENQQRADNATREKAFESLSKSYDDFDKESVMAMVKGLEDVPQDDQMRTFMELLYQAGKGRMTPAEVEKKIAHNLENKSRLSTPMGSTKGAPNKGTPGFTTLNEARDAAMKDL